MMKKVQPLSATTGLREVGAYDVPPIHPSLRALLGELGLDDERAPSDAKWRAFLTSVGAAVAAAAVDRRQAGGAAGLVIAELAAAAGLASTDGLIDAASGLPNADALLLALRSALRESSDTSEVAVLMVGLDGMHRVSDRLGEEGKRELLTNAAERVRSVVRSVDLVARGHDDEFTVLLGGMGSAEPVRAISHRIERAFSEPLMAVGHYVYFTADVGAALARSGSSAHDAIRRGRMALEWQRSTRNHPAGRTAHVRQVAAFA
jgi:diguanylate cyclase (GGDEF)-like protein